MPDLILSAEPSITGLGAVHNQVLAIWWQFTLLYDYVRGVQSNPNYRFAEQEAGFFLQIYNQLSECDSVAAELKRYLPVLNSAAREFANPCAHAVGLCFALDIYNKMRTAVSMGPLTGLLELVQGSFGELPPIPTNTIKEACEAEYYRAVYQLEIVDAPAAGE